MDEAPDKIWFNDAKPTEHRFVSRSSFAGGIEYTRTDTITALEAAAHARGKAEGIREAAEVCTKNAKAIRKADDYFNLRKPRGEWRAQQCDTDSAAILALLPPDAPDPAVTVEQAREYAIDTIEEIIGETHDIDVSDRRYAENIVAWMERHHPATLRALAGEASHE